MSNLYGAFIMPLTLCGTPLHRASMSGPKLMSRLLTIVLPSMRSLNRKYRMPTPVSEIHDYFYTIRFWREYGTLFDDIAKDPTIRAVVLSSGLQKAFSAGVDRELYFHLLYLSVSILTRTSSHTHSRLSDRPGLKLRSRSYSIDHTANHPRIPASYRRSDALPVSCDRCRPWCRIWSRH